MRRLEMKTRECPEACVLVGLVFTANDNEEIASNKL